MTACECGRGCPGRGSITSPRIKSERDAIARYLRLYGPMPVYAEGDPSTVLYVIESIDDPRIDEPTPKAPRRPREDAEPDPLRKARQNEAIAYIRDYVGRWDFILDLRADRRWGTKWFRLSDRQVDVILRAKARDAERAVERQREQSGRDLNVLPYGRTLAAVDNDSGGVTFLVFDRPEPRDRFGQPNKWRGWVFVKQQQGPDLVRLGAQRPGETYVGQWPSLIDRVLADPVAAVARYGRELGICGVCGSPLTNDESREAGIGPVCRSKIAA